jgi:hypothetical protein
MKTMSKAPRALMPEIGNLAWAPLASVEGVEIFDRFNVVPTVGVLRADGNSHLFWRVLFYVSDISAWMYVPLSSRDLKRLDRDDDDLLSGVVVQSPSQRYVTLACAHDNRLIFEREWQLPAKLNAEKVVSGVVEFLLDSMRIALQQDPRLPASRREMIQKAADAVQELVPC